MNHRLDDVEFFSISECIARALKDALRQTMTDNQEVRRQVREILLRDPLRACRGLWRTGSPEMRASLAARIRVWLDRPGGAEYSRYLARERGRAKASPTRTPGFRHET